MLNFISIIARISNLRCFIRKYVLKRKGNEKAIFLKNKSNLWLPYLSVFFKMRVALPSISRDFSPF